MGTVCPEFPEKESGQGCLSRAGGALASGVFPLAVSMGDSIVRLG